ncbi:MAG: dihydrodipicolinate synthase family protein [Anaerolineae bacterium]|nr:dihydrodipicolinate synthase family protein [Anaerolineae bacterium]
MTIDIRGVIPPMLTPLTEDRQLDIPALHRLVDHMIDGGVDGIFALGTSGEGTWLTDTFCRAVVHETMSATRGRVPILVGLLQPNAPRVLDMLDWVQSSGAAAVVVTTPFYFEADAPTQEAHFRTIAQASPLPVVVYNIPSKTHNPLLPDVMERMLEEPNIVALKNSTTDIDSFVDMLRVCQQRPGFRVLQGTARLILASLQHGADGIVPGLGNLFPEIFVQMMDYVESNQSEQADALQARINALWEVHAQTYWLTGLKYAASVLGLCSSLTISHHCPLDAPIRAAIEQIVREHGTIS